MKSAKILTLLALTVAFFSATAFGNGVLRIPHQHRDDEYMPLKEIHVNIEIHDQIAITTIRDVFRISGENHVDATFHFRLPAAASVTGFGYWNGDEFVPYFLRPGEQGGPGGGAPDNADLRNYLSENPFSIFLDSIPPGSFAVQLQYAELLPYDFGVVSAKYPFNLGQFLFATIDSVSLEVSINSRRQMSEILCTGEQNQLTHIAMQGQYNATAELKINNLRPRADWQLNIRFNQEDIGGWLYTHRGDSSSAGYFMLVMEPGIVDPEEQVRKYFTFVFDRSGSMNGTKIVQARSAAITCLNRLIANDNFNVIDFATDVRLFRQNMIPASAANITSARNYVNALPASGSTNIYGALTAAVSQNMGEGTVNQVVFITDGLPTAGESTDSQEIINAVANANQHNARIFCFGIGQDVNHGLLNGLAFGNRGRAYFVDTNRERIDSTIAHFFQYIATPALGNPVVDFGDGLEIDSLAPVELQDISAGRQLYLFGRYDSFGNYEVALTGRMVDGDTTFSFTDMEFPEWNEENAFVPRMWAKATIDYWIDWIDVHGENQRIINKIIELSLRFSILTRYTEFEEPDAVEEPAIAMVQATPVTGGIELNWSAVGVTSFAVYNVYRAEGKEAPFTRLNDSPLRTTTFFDAQTRPGEPARYQIEMIIDGKSVWSLVIEVGTLPDMIALAIPYPNPFNASTSITYTLPKESSVDLFIYDSRGQLVETLVHGAQSAGSHSLIWDAASVPAGIYILKLETTWGARTQKLILLK